MLSHDYLKIVCEYIERNKAIITNEVNGEIEQRRRENMWHQLTERLELLKDESKIPDVGYKVLIEEWSRRTVEKFSIFKRKGCGVKFRGYIYKMFYRIEWKTTDGRIATKTVGARELFLRDAKAENGLPQCTDDFLKKYLRDPKALVSLRILDEAGNKENYRQIRVITYGETEQELKSVGLDDLGRGKRLMFKKTHMDTPETLQARAINVKGPCVKIMRSNDNESNKQRLKDKRMLKKIKKAVSIASMEKLKLHGMEFLSIPDDERIKEIEENEAHDENVHDMSQDKCTLEKNKELVLISETNEEEIDVETMLGEIISAATNTKANDANEEKRTEELHETPFRKNVNVPRSSKWRDTASNSSPGEEAFLKKTLQNGPSSFGEERNDGITEGSQRKSSRSPGNKLEAIFGKNSSFAGDKNNNDRRYKTWSEIEAAAMSISNREKIDTNVIHDRKRKKNNDEVSTINKNQPMIPKKVLKKIHKPADRTNGEDPFNFENDESDISQRRKKPKELSAPVEKNAQQKNVNGRKVKQTVSNQKMSNEKSPSVSSSSATCKNDERSAPTSDYSQGQKERFKNAYNEMLKTAVNHMKQVKKFGKLMNEDDIEESPFELLDILSDDETEDVEITPGWRIHRDIIIQAGLAPTMSKRLATLMSALWSREEREKLIIKKTRNKKNDGRREITVGEARQLMSACMALQSMKILSVNEVDTIENIKISISKKLKNDRYNSFRWRKRNGKKSSGKNAKARGNIDKRDKDYDENEEKCADDDNTNEDDYDDPEESVEDVDDDDADNDENENDDGEELSDDDNSSNGDNDDGVNCDDSDLSTNN
ncbi:protein PFC0760c-like [Venturia canescens]|nr:protein PFC0760c-like [Venturia canescens]